MRGKCHIVGRDWSVMTLMTNYGFELVKTIEDCDVMVLTGGADIDPSIYGHPKHHTVHGNKQRDALEIEAAKTALSLNKPIAGICRGGQLMHALLGGVLWQDVDGHFGDHLVYNHQDGKEYLVTSIHHQMMVPNDNTRILASCNISKNCTIWLDGYWYDQRNSLDIEALLYRKQRVLCFQGHPEYDDFLPDMNRTTRLFDSYLRLIGV